jgi:hypothetical protein
MLVTISRLCMSAAFVAELLLGEEVSVKSPSLHKSSSQHCKHCDPGSPVQSPLSSQSCFRLSPGARVEHFFSYDFQPLKRVQTSTRDDYLPTIGVDDYLGVAYLLDAFDAGLCELLLRTIVIESLTAFVAMKNRFWKSSKKKSKLLVVLCSNQQVTFWETGKSYKAVGAQKWLPRRGCIGHHSGFYSVKPWRHYVWFLFISPISPPPCTYNESANQTTDDENRRLNRLQWGCFVQCITPAYIIFTVY